MNKITATGPDFTVTVEYEDLPLREAVDLVVATSRALRENGRPDSWAPSRNCGCGEWYRVSPPVLELGKCRWYVNQAGDSRFMVET